MELVIAWQGLPTWLSLAPPRERENWGVLGHLVIMWQRCKFLHSTNALQCQWGWDHSSFYGVWSKAGVECVHDKSLRSCLALCDAMDCGPSGSFVHGILQARILEWVAVPSSRGSS